MSVDDSGIALFNFPICISGNLEGIGSLYLSKIFALSVCVYIVFDETLIHSTIYFRQKYEIKEVQKSN
jgi:hypothetical protein